MKSWVDKSIKSSLGYTYRLLKRWIVKLHVHNVSLRNNNIFCLIAGSKQTYWYVILITDQFNHKGGYIRVDLCFLNQIIRFFFESLTVSYWPYCVYISIALFDQLATVVVEAKFFEEDFSTGPKSHNRSFLLDFEWNGTWLGAVAVLLHCTLGHKSFSIYFWFPCFSILYFRYLDDILLYLKPNS